MSDTQYIDKELFFKNTIQILEENGEKFDTHKEMIEFVLEEFTPEQIDEVVADMPFCDDKQHFFYAVKEAYKITLEDAYKSAWKNVCPEESYEEQLPTIDQSFDDTVGVFNLFFICLEQNAETLKLVEGVGLGDIFRMM